MKNCKFCDKDGTAWVYPLLYSVVVGENASDLSALPELNGLLGGGVTDIVLSPQARYAVRRVRAGFIYMLIERAGFRYWRAYQVLDDGFLHLFDAEHPPVAAANFTCERNGCGVGASVIGIEKVSTVDNAWLLFAPSAMTKATLDDYRENAPAYARKGKLRYFDAKGWAAGSTAQPHTMKPERLMATAVEFILFRQHQGAATSPLGQTLKRQLFEASSDAYAGTAAAADGTESGFLGVLSQRLIQQKAAVLVLDDPIGITQELNDFRNAALEPIDAFLLTKDARQVDNQRKLEISQAIEDVRMGCEKGLILRREDYLNTSDASSEVRIKAQLNRAREAREAGDLQTAKLHEDEVARFRAERDAGHARLLEEARAKAPEHWRKKYATRLDLDEISAFNKTLKAFSDRGLRLATQRAEDHMKWVTSDRLVQAFDVFDPRSPSSGFGFTLHHTICTIGMVGVQKSAGLVETWIKVDKVERTNLYLRAYLFNQQHLQEEANKALAEIKSLVAPASDISLVDGKLWLKASKGLVDAFKKADSAWDEWVRDRAVRKVHLEGMRPEHSTDIRSLSKFHRTAEGVVFKFMSEFTQTTARTAVGGRLDKTIAGVSCLMIGSRLGRLSEDLAHDLLMLRIPPEKLAEGYKGRSAARNAELQERHVERRAAKVAAQTEDAVEVLIRDAQDKARTKVKLTLDELEKGKRGETNNYHQARIGAVLMALESIALSNKLQHFDKSDRARADIAASILSLTSIGLDMLYAVAKSIREIEPYRSIPAIERAADILRGGLKLGAGTLATAAGAIGAVLDFQSGLAERGKHNTDAFLMTVYVTRGTFGLWSAYVGLSAAFSYCAPFLIRTGAIVGRFSFQALSYAAYGALVAEGLAVSRTLLLIRLARLNLIGLVLTGAEIGYRLFFKDDELQDWCDACTFRKDKATGLFKPKPYENKERELTALYQAAQSVGAVG